MDRKPLFALIAPAVLLHGCSEQPASPGDDGAANGPVVTADTEGRPGIDPVPAPPPRADGMRDAVDDGYPDMTPPVLTPDAERTETGARNVLISFARAIELGEYAQARAMLSAADRRRWSEAEFAAMFADLSKITVAAPGGTMEGAAGSSFYTAPITITATGKDGRPVRMEGEAVLRRVNDVDGASEAQRRWHFDRLTLDWTH